MHVTVTMKRRASSQNLQQQNFTAMEILLRNLNGGILQAPKPAVAAVAEKPEGRKLCFGAWSFLGLQ